MQFSISPVKNPLVIRGVQSFISDLFPRFETGAPEVRREVQIGAFNIYELNGAAVPTHLAVNPAVNNLAVDRNGAILYALNSQPNKEEKLSVYVTDKAFHNLQSPRLTYPEARLDVTRPNSTVGLNILCTGHEGQVFNAMQYPKLQATQVVAFVGFVGKTTPEKPQGTDTSYGAFVLVEPVTVVRSR